MAEEVTEVLPELSEVDLRDGFQSFVLASRRLEDSYSELKTRAEAIDLELSASNKKLAATLSERETVFSAMPVGVAVIAAIGEVSWLNPEAQRLLAIASESGMDLTTVESGLLEFANLSLHVSRVDLPEDGSLVVIEDRSKLVDLERQVHRLDRLAGLSELALGVAHEIKNPLNGVVGFASLMQRSEDPTTMQRFAGKILTGLQQVDEIVKAMLDFAKPESKSVAYASVESIVGEAAMLAGVGAHSLRCSGAMDAQAQKFALVRVLTNLFRNSVEAGHADRDVSIDLFAEEVDGDLRIEVRDDGPGIPADLGDKVFEPFVSTKDRGYGLGLALSCRVLSFLGGSVELTNQGEVGACFEVRVPCQVEAVIARPESMRSSIDA